MRMMKVEQVDPCAVAIPHRLRAVDTAKVVQIGESMAAIGLQQPITVWSHEDDECELIAGAHRLQAAVDLGWDWIDVVFHDDWSEIDRQLWEIDENLMRAELSPSEHAEHVTRRKELWEQREIQVAQVEPPEKPAGYKSPPKQKKGFAADTAEISGVSKAAINRSISRAKAIPGDIRAIIKHTKLDTGVYLDSLKGLAPDEQRAKVRDDLAEPNKPQSTRAKVVARADQFAALMRDWNKASDDERRRFLDWATAPEKPGEMPIDEIVERLRSGLKQGRIEDRDRGFVAGVLKQSKSGRWWPTPKQEALVRRLVDELMAEPVIDTEDCADG